MGLDMQRVGARGAGGVDFRGIGGGGDEPAGTQQVTQLLEKLLKKLLGQDDPNAAKCNGAGAPKQAAQAQDGDAAGGDDWEELLKKLQQLAQNNPGALQQAFMNNPALMQVAQVALGGGGGAGSIGKVG